jgi:hypothetical protein
MGTDLTTAIRQVGLALQDPVNGLQLLRRAGVAFDDSQKSLIKSLVETGQLTKAQNVILGELEKRFKGSAAAARNTLGGALTGLKNQFGDLFEGSSESSKKAADAINEITKALQDPELKKGIDALIEGSAKIAANFIKAAVAQGRTLKEGLGIGDFANQFTRGGGPRRGGLRGSTAPEAEAFVQPIEEVTVTVRKIVDQNADALRDLEEETRTSTERVSAAYSRLKAALQTLLDEGKITKDQFNERLQAGITDTLGLQEIDLNEIRAKYTSLKKSTTEVGEFMKGVWRGVGNSIRQTLSDAIYEWNLSWKSLLDIVRRALADILSAIITSGIAKALKSQLSSSGGSSGSGSGWASFIAGIGGALFGAASGGRMDGLRWVGEDGPELAAGSGYIYNKRQMAFAGMGGASINYAPTFNLNIQSNGDKETEQRMAAFVDRRISQSQAEFARTLHRSGVEVRG